jgi:hypothetical protein
MIGFRQLLKWLFGERNYEGPMDRSAGVLWIRTGTFFLGAMNLFKSIDDYVKGCHIQLIMSTYVLCVSGFSCRIYID